jgi:hypothetical protein
MQPRRLDGPKADVAADRDHAELIPGQVHSAQGTRREIDLDRVGRGDLIREIAIDRRVTNARAPYGVKAGQAEIRG